MRPLTDNVSARATISPGLSQWYEIQFVKSGNANFYIKPDESDLDIDLEVYNEDYNKLGSSSKGAGKYDLVNLPVAKGKKYYMKVIHYAGPSGSYEVKCKRYDDTTTENYDLVIEDITVEQSEPFDIGEYIEFNIKVRNNGESESPKYKVVAYDENGDEVDHDREGELDSGNRNAAHLAIKYYNKGSHKIKFTIEVDGESVYREYRTYTWGTGGTTEDYDLVINSIEPDDPERYPFPLGKGVLIKVTVQNKGTQKSPEYSVVMYDKNNKKLYTELEKDTIGKESLCLVANFDEAGNHRLKFVIMVDGKCVDEKYKTFTWGNEEEGTDIEKAQKYLLRIGYAIGTVDGSWGPKCIKAAQSFQQIKGISKTGKLDSTLLRELKKSYDSNERLETLQEEYYESTTRSSAGLVRMLEFGIGYITSFGDHNDIKWLTPEVAESIVTACKEWSEQSTTLIQLSEMSAEGGTTSGHISHQKGIDIDIRPLKKDDSLGGTNVDYSNYSREKTENFIKILLSDSNVDSIFFEDSVLYNKYTKVRPYKKAPELHKHHLHVHF
ncbi:peptidoglycan-binding domain-containing protein [Clostridiaceae bacterium M8S5]|nr:peptidoglycan-binding domain-containing protein [Clostridiaceae bacterium M8S5]